MNKFVERNINELKKLKRKQITDKTTQATKKRIDEIIKLYTERKLSNVATAENYIKGLTSTNKKVYDKTFQKYKDNIIKIKETKPLKERMNETKKRNKKKTYFVDYQIFTYYKGDLKESGIKQKPAFTHQGVHYFIWNFDAKSVTIKATDFPKDVINKRTFRWLNVEDLGNRRRENPEYTMIIELLRQDEDFDSHIKYHEAFYDTLGCIKIRSVDVANEKGEKFDIMTENLTEASNISIYHNYIYTILRTDAETIKQGIEKGHYIENLCWVNALTDYYKDTIMSDTRRKNLTTEKKFIDIIGKDNFREEGASIKDMENVFKEYSIQVRIFDFFNKLIYKYDHVKRNHHIKCFYAMVQNNHIYALNHNLKEIQQKQLFSDVPLVKASSDYYISEREEPPKYQMITDVDDITKIEVDDDVKEVYLTLSSNKLTEAFFKLVNSGYEPRITFQAGIISEIRMKFNKISYIIKTQNLLKNSPDGCIAVNEETTYNNMSVAMFNFCKSLLNPSHKSFYNDIDIEILDEARTIVPLGFTEERVKSKGKTEIDVSKAFTDAFLKIDGIPVFNQFDIWKKYNKSIKIEELHHLTLYIVKLIPYDCMYTKWYNKTSSMLNKRYCLVYGLFLKEILKDDEGRLNDETFEVLYYKIPSQIHKVNYKEIVDELWNNSISKDTREDKCIKKLIANVNFGLLEKGGSTNQKSLVFKSVNEAMEYQANYGGKLLKINDVEVGMEENEEEIKQSYYILNIRDKAKLRNGFRYIKELLLQHHNFKMKKAYFKLLKNGISVYSVKTAAFVIDTVNLEKTKEVLEFHNDIGGWRTDKHNENIILPSVNYDIMENEHINIPMYENKHIDVENEYDTDNIIEEIKVNNPMMIRGELPGAGKSFICQKMVDKGYTVIFVCPTNKLLQAFEGEALTLNKFFGISFGDVKLEPFDYSNYDVIVFDEIYFSSLNTYWRIKQFVEQNKDSKIVIATGDTKQLKPIQPLTNIQDYETYADHIIDNIFENNILRKECKRLHTQEDKDKLNNIKYDWFINKLPLKKWIEKYFKYTTDISGSKNNIAYLNDTCKNVAKEIRKLENRKGEYEVGEFLICREYTKTKTSVFNVNFQYKIVHIGNDNIMTLKNVKTQILQSIHIDKVRKNFIFAYCMTCHSAQGSSIDGDITIFDWNHFDIRNYREWIWTAIARCRDLNKVKFFKYNSDKTDEFNYKCMMSYDERKIANYKDRKAKRKIPKEGYVNVEWFLENIKNQCNYCGCGFVTSMNNGNITTNLTCQRVNNEYTHTLDNIVAYCKRCNCSCK